MGLVLGLWLLLTGCSVKRAATDPFFSPLPKTRICESYQLGLVHYQEARPRGAVEVWKGVVYAGDDGSVCYRRSFYNIPVVYIELEDYGSANIWFKKVLASTLDDRQEGTNIMEPYANYHHEAAIGLARLAYRNDDMPDLQRYFL